MSDEFQSYSYGGIIYIYVFIFRATRDCPLGFDGSEVTRVDFGLPNSRKSDANLNIKVFGDLLEHPSPICARQQVATINCQFYGDRDECESQEAMYVYQSLNKKSSLLQCTLGVSFYSAVFCLVRVPVKKVSNLIKGQA